MDTFSHTPLLTVLDSRALAVRNVAFHRLPDDDATREDVSAVEFDLAGRVIKLWDARLWARAQEDSQTQPNRTHHYNLSGVPLLSISVDEGWDLSLLRESGVVERSWETKGASWSNEYDAILRPISRGETAPDNVTRTMARFIYADSSEDSAKHNQCGQMITLHDGAGLTTSSEFSVLGQCLTESRQFLQETELPDWSGSPPTTPEKITRSTFNALTQLITQTDASGNRQRFGHNVEGSTRQAWLTLKEEAETLILGGVDCNAMGQTERETLGNGVVRTWVYDPVTQRLETTRTFAHDTLAQELAYRYDAVGNVTQINETTQTTRFFRNQEVAPTNLYRYDSLYQLVEATGRESVDSSDSHRPPDAAAPNPGDTSQLLNYRETYRYDQGGNMLELRHVRDGNTYTRSFDVAPNSNRSLLKTDATPGFDTAFDGAGNLLALQPGQGLQWGLRNQLQKVVTIPRANGADDEEVYVYDGSDQRLRKQRTFRTQGTTRIENVYYLPGLELRTCGTAAKKDEHLEVIVLQAGSSNVRCLHWVNGKPEGTSQNQLRYSLTDHLGSCTMEWDDDARLLSHEGYLPFGGTAWWAAQSSLEGYYKTIRYSGKERDASGLYYYGYRYYAPWLQRWINPDPGGKTDGLNLYQFVQNNPLSFFDLDGRETVDEIMNELNEISHLTNQSTHPPSNASRMAARNLRKQLRPLLEEEVEVHLTVIGELDLSLGRMARQHDNIYSHSARNKSLGKRVGLMSFSAGTGAAVGATVGSLAGPAGGLAGAALGSAAGLVVKSAIIEPIKDKFGMAPPIHLKTTPLNAENVWNNARRKLLSLEKAKDTVDRYNPQTPKGIMNLTAAAARKTFSTVVGKIGEHAVDFVDITDDYSSSMAGKSPYKIDLMITELEKHQQLLKDNITKLKPAMLEYEKSFPKGIEQSPYVVAGRFFNHEKLASKTTKAINRLSLHITRLKHF